jgi:uncharacterized protein YqjF (DUF2071 family)
MKNASTSAYSRELFAIVLVGLLPTFAAPAEAQSAGNNAVYSSSNAITPSLSFIDASIFIGNGSTRVPISAAWSTASFRASTTPCDWRGYRRARHQGLDGADVSDRDDAVEQ